ncbi:hypothetical protein IW262DRAFT_235291 [Armillaria fumosa]|nr:hypothetical protein IW262DRAFT_235291 [Armillaria fumosa]
MVGLSIFGTFQLFLGHSVTHFWTAKSRNSSPKILGTKPCGEPTITSRGFYGKRFRIWRISLIYRPFSDVFLGTKITEFKVKNPGIDAASQPSWRRTMR